MKSIIRKLIIITNLFIVNAFAAQMTLENLLLSASKNANYKAPTSTEVKRAETLFRQLFRGDTSNLIKKQWEELGFEILHINENGKDIIVLREIKSKKWGRGFYAFQSKVKANLLQATHAFSDEDTGAIVAELFKRFKFSATAWNTAHRKQADVAHLTSSYMLAFSRAFALEMPNYYIIQLHGFSQNKRKTAAARNAHIILSTGSFKPLPFLFQMETCLKNNVNREVLIFPVDVSELGATTNAIGDMLRAMQNEHFIHIELSREMRTALLQYPQLLEKLNLCFPK